MRKWSISSESLTTAGLVIALLFILLTTGITYKEAPDHNGGAGIDMPESDTAFAGIFSTPQLNDSLPHYLYRRMEDSVKRAKAESELENMGEDAAGINMALFGVYSIDKPQVYTSKRAGIAEKDKEKYYYVAFNGYKLNENSKFFIQNEKFNLAYVKWDTLKREPNISWRQGHYERKEIRVRYSPENKQVLVPVTRRQYEVLHAVFYVLVIVFAMVALYVFLGLPIQVLISISKGNAFDKKNVRDLNIVARAFFVLGLLGLLLPYVFDLFLGNMVPDEFKRITIVEGLLKTRWLFLLAIVVFIIGKAFKKGNTLQKEQDLTI